MTDFVRYPHTPHLAALSAISPRGDKVLSAKDVRELLAEEVIVEEKVDGANLGISVSEDGEIAVQNRGDYVTRSSAAGQFRPLWGWLSFRTKQLIDTLRDERIIFGEWCYARHSVAYSRLPDWFLMFDVYDRRAQRFWSVERRNDLANELGIASVPLVARGRFHVADLVAMIGKSQFGDDPMEGIVVCRDQGNWQVSRAKLVRAAFVQEIEEHWSHRRIVPNGLAKKSEFPNSP